MEITKTDTDQKITAFLTTLDETCKTLKPYYDEEFLHPAGWNRLKQHVDSLKHGCQKEDDDFRLLRIGILGAVKAGKSTFLNVLLFDGQTVLPAAATPMTASLTRLFYSEEPSIKFVFYSLADWNEICQESENAKRWIEKKMKEEKEKYEKSQQMSNGNVWDFNEETVRNALRRRLPDSQQACMELVEETRRLNLNVGDELGRESEQCKFGSLEELGEKLRETVSSKGKYAAIVRHVEIGLNHSLLRDLEIIDTPGLNDPVQSRSNETYKFLSSCDAAILLSYAGQFLSEQDQELFSKKMPSEGVERDHIILVASKMDMAYLDHDVSACTFSDAVKKTYHSVCSTFKKAFPDIASEPLCISTFLDSMAFKAEHDKAFSEEERHVLEKLSAYQHAPAKEESKKWRSLANLSAVQKKLKVCRANKDKIKAEHKRDLLRSKHSALRECLQDLENTARADQKTLATGDMEELRQSVQTLKHSMDGIWAQMNNLFSEKEKKLREVFNDVEMRIARKCGDYNDNLTTDTVVRHETITRKKGFYYLSHISKRKITKSHIRSHPLMPPLIFWTIFPQQFKRISMIPTKMNFRWGNFAPKPSDLSMTLLFVLMSILAKIQFFSRSSLVLTP